MNVETTNKILLLVLSVMNGNELLVWRVGGGGGGGRHHFRGVQ